MTYKKNVDVAVIGRGMLGTSAARHLAELGASVTLFGPEEPKNNSTHNGVFGSHYDTSRITRILDRNPYYSKIASASISRYRSLEDLTGINFYQDVGQITVSGMHPYLDELTDCATSNSLNHRILDNADLASTFPYLKFSDGMTGIHEIVTAGHINPRKFIAAQGEALRISKGDIIEKTVININDKKGEYIICCADKSELNCKQVLVATGAFANHFDIIPKKISIEVAEHTIVLGEVSKNTFNILSKMPCVIYHKTDDIYGSVYILPPIKYPEGRIWIKIGQSRGYVMNQPEKNLIPWFQGKGDTEISKWLHQELFNILPDTKLLSTKTASCVTTKSKSGFQFIDKFRDTEIYSCLVGDGQAAKSADEIGRIAAHRVLYGNVPKEYSEVNFQIQYL